MPEGLDVHLVMDNYATHKTEKVRNWLARRRHWHVHFTPTSASWINQVERWFAELTRKKLQRGVHRSVAELNADIMSFIDAHNEKPKPYKWVKSADEILASVRRFCLKANALGESEEFDTNLRFGRLGMESKVLIVEDDQFKAEDLRREAVQECKTSIVGSVRDAVVTVLNEVFDVVVLDMALPTFTADAASASGTAQPQGGVEVLRALKSVGAGTPVIIVSQYPDLEVDGEFLSLERSPEVLSVRYGINVIGAVVYDFQDRTWSEPFREMLRPLLAQACDDGGEG